MWPLATISDVGSLFDGPHATPQPVDDGPFFLGIQNFTGDGRLDFTNAKRLSEEDFPRWTRRVLPAAGDVVFSYEATLNLYAVIPEGFRGSLGRRIALIRPNKTKVDSRFLLYYFATPEWRGVIANNTLTGATVDRIPLKTFPSFPIRLPPLDVQQKISSVIFDYDELISNNLRRIELLEEAAQLLYKEWFISFRFPGAEHCKVVDGVPEDWAKGTISTFTSQVADGDWIESKDQGGDDYRIVQISNVGINCFVETGNMRFINEQTFKRLRCQQIVPGDVLVARMPDPIGRAWLVPEMPWRLVTAVDVAIIKPNPDVFASELLVLHLNSESSLATCAANATGATRPRVTRKIIAGLPVLLPPRVVQREFLTVIQPIFQQMNGLRKQNERLQEARDLLLPRLMSGEIEV